MEVDPPSGSRLSVVCSAPAEYSSNSSESSSPNSRRNSMNESVIKNESYWERRRKNNDASKRSREKRRLSDIAMEQKLIALSRENELLKNRLESRDSNDVPMGSRASVDYAAALPSQSNTLSSDIRPLLTASMPLSMASTSSISTSVLPNVLPTNPLPMLQIAQLQAAIQQQYNATRPPCVFSVGSAFTPFQAHKESVIMKAERTSPDSSSDRPPLISNVIKRVPSPPTSDRSHQQPQPSLLSALLAARRTSPTVPQSRTEHHSGLRSPPRASCSKSDSESISSSASFSPTHSSEDHSDGTAAIRRALSGDGKSREYIDRRKRNNEAAKRCRANRRAVFEYRSRRVQLLEQENEQLKDEIGRLKAELEQQKALLTSLHQPMNQ